MFWSVVDRWVVIERYIPEFLEFAQHAPSAIDKLHYILLPQFQSAYRLDGRKDHHSKCQYTFRNRIEYSNERISNHRSIDWVVHGSIRSHRLRHSSICIWNNIDSIRLLLEGNHIGSLRIHSLTHTNGKVWRHYISGSLTHVRTHVRHLLWHHNHVIYSMRKEHRIVWSGRNQCLPVEVAFPGIGCETSEFDELITWFIKGHS